jgi:hypothetical protein
MESGNPFQSPVPSDTSGSSVSSFPVLRTVGSGLLALVACVIMSSVSGQAFTNGVIILLLCLGSLLLWFPLMVGKGTHQRLARLVILGHIALIIAICITLPAQYKAQQRFNEKMQQLRHPQLFQRKL